jgi:hypothetical protein
MHDGELRDRVRALVRDVGPLGTVSAIGFADDDRERVKRAVGVVACESWRFADVGAGDAEAALETALKGARDVVVVRTDAKHPPRALIDLVRDVVDGKDRRFSRQEGVSVILLCEGATTIEGVEDRLRRIPYWDFVP